MGEGGGQERRGVWVSVGNKGKLFAGRAPVVKPHSVQRAVPGKTRGREGGFNRGNNPKDNEKYAARLKVDCVRMWPFKGKSKGEKIQVCEVAINTKTTNTKLDNFRIRRMQWTTRTTRSSRQRKIKKRPRRKLRLRMVVTLPTLCTISPNNWTWPKRHR